MNIQDYLYEAMFHRKSIRKFKDEMLNNNVVRSVEERIKQLRPLFPEEQIAFRILSDDQIKGQVKGSTHHIAVYAKQGLKSYVNAGFMMQQMDLWLSANGMGSWWHVSSKPSKQWSAVEGLPFVFLITFGIADETLYREPSDFKRKPVSELTNCAEIHKFVEPVRFAPSAFNQQPWFFTCCDGKILMYCKKANSLLSLFFGNMSRLNAGIGLCHLWLAIEHEGKCFHVECEGNAPYLGKKMEYICSIKD